jgi:hypothetical protein
MKVKKKKKQGNITVEILKRNRKAEIKMSTRSEVWTLLMH